MSSVKNKHLGKIFHLKIENVYPNGMENGEKLMIKICIKDSCFYDSEFKFQILIFFERELIFKWSFIFYFAF